MPTEGYHSIHSEKIHDNQRGIFIHTTGLTKREYFAAMAMQGIISTGNGFDSSPDFAAHVAKTATIYADALITALNSTK